MRVVIDTSVVVSAVRSSGGASRPVLVAALQNRFAMLVSVPLFLEYESVLKRPETLDAARLKAADVDDLLDAIATVATPVYLAYRWRPQLKDPADEMVLETAVNGTADWITTFNQRDFGIAPERFGIGLAGPAALLGLLAADEEK